MSDTKTDEWLHWLKSLLGVWWGWVLTFALLGLWAGAGAVLFFIVMIIVTVIFGVRSGSPVVKLWWDNTQQTVKEHWENKPK